MTSYCKQQQAEEISYLEEALKRQVCFAEYKQHSFSGPRLFSSPHAQRAQAPRLGPARQDRDGRTQPAPGLRIVGESRSIAIHNKGTYQNRGLLYRSYSEGDSSFIGFETLTCYKIRRMEK